MAEWAQKRFWDKAEVREEGTGFGVTLDGRAVRSPAKTPLIVPTRALAEEIAAEWNAQDGVIDPTSMPFTRTANAAIDKVAPQKPAVGDMLADYGDSDLLCYRATDPEALVARQRRGWDPLLDWAAETLGARLAPRAGVMHTPQEPAALDRLRTKVHEMDAFRLAAFHDLVTLSGSLVLGFAAAHGVRPADELWELSRLDEAWQEERWGQDDEAQAAAALKKAAFHHAHRFFQLCENPATS